MGVNHHHSDESSNLDRFIDQLMGKEQREYPAGRMGADDDGALSYAIASDDRYQTIVIRFGKPVEWIGLGLADAVALRDNLNERIVSMRTGV